MFPFTPKYCSVYPKNNNHSQEIDTNTILLPEPHNLLRSCQLSQYVRKGIFKLNHTQVTLQQYHEVRVLYSAPSLSQTDLQN